MSFIAEESPFEIPHEHVQMLCNDEGFQILRTYLARNAKYGPAFATQHHPSPSQAYHTTSTTLLTSPLSFCADHVTASSQTKETWLLHRDLLHALTMPIYQLFSRASTLASAALCTRAPEDLELAFSGEARGAFLCLQCFITEEEDWCQTKGCPGTYLTTASHPTHPPSTNNPMPQPAQPSQPSQPNPTSASQSPHPSSPPPPPRPQPRNPQPNPPPVPSHLSPTSYLRSAKPSLQTPSGAQTPSTTSCLAPSN